MPSVPTYLHRLASTIEVLERLDTEWVDRRTLEEALGVGKWTAWRIMRQCGAEEGPGNTLICRRKQLILDLRRLQEDRRFGPEIQRRKRVETYLDSIVKFASRSHREIARDEHARELLASRLNTLPAGVDLQPGELRIVFEGCEDFLQKVGALVYTLHNELEQVEEFLEADRR